MGGTKRRRRGGTAGCQLTERDLEIVSWLDRLGGGSVEQIRRRFGLGRTQGYRRLQVLEDFGLVRRVDLLVQFPGLYVAPRQSVSAWHIEHTLRLIDLVVDLELAGRVILGDLEVRRERFGAGAMETRLDEEQMAVVVGRRMRSRFAPTAAWSPTKSSSAPRAAEGASRS
jgi:DNA-binding Lrp family transcriptional regulator